MVSITKKLLFVVCCLVGGGIVQANENEHAPYDITINIRSDDYGKLLMFAIDDLYTMDIHDALLLEKCDIVFNLAKQVVYKSPIALLDDNAGHYIQMVKNCIARKLDHADNGDDQCKVLLEIIHQRYIQLIHEIADLCQTMKRDYDDNSADEDCSSCHQK